MLLLLCKPLLSVYLAGSCYPPPHRTTSRGSSSINSDTAGVREQPHRDLPVTTTRELIQHWKAAALLSCKPIIVLLVKHNQVHGCESLNVCWGCVLKMDKQRIPSHHGSLSWINSLIQGNKNGCVPWKWWQIKLLIKATSVEFLFIN